MFIFKQIKSARPTEQLEVITWGQFKEDSLTFFTEPGCSLFMSLKSKAEGTFIVHTKSRTDR